MLKNCKADLLPSLATAKRQRNLNYLQSLKDDNLLLPFRYEAGLINHRDTLTEYHKGWDSPFSQIRGTFTGHWLSAMALLYDDYRIPLVKTRADHIVNEIAFCQKENGGQWAFPIPEKYLHWIKIGKRVWAPQYVCHKVMMGLLDMYRYTDNVQALKVLKGCAEWFYDFTNDISREVMDEMMDFEETGGIMELWADLYEITNNPKHLALIKRYERPRLFEPLLRGEDVLTNLHANTTVPEIHGAARAYEVTGEKKYREIVENYWKLAVDDRGMFVTGGQTSGEVWTPINQQARRLSNRTQEHCVVYNMMTLSHYLYRWTGEAKYADYFEQNLYNGIFAQGYWAKDWDVWVEATNLQPSEHLAYFLGLGSGSKKVWGSETEHFWCCHCTLVQANAFLYKHIFFQDDDNIFVAHFFPATLKTDLNGKEISVTLITDSQAGETIRIHKVDREVLTTPKCNKHILTVTGNDTLFSVRIRLPWWLSGPAEITVNGESINVNTEYGHAVIKRVWGNNDIVHCTFPKGLIAWPLPDRPNCVAFIYGPVALAGITAEERTLYGDVNNPESFMIPDNERLWHFWQANFRTINQPINFRFVPLYNVGHEEYTVYFPVKALS